MGSLKIGAPSHHIQTNLGRVVSTSELKITDLL